MELYHFVRTARGFLRLGDPATHHRGALGRGHEQMRGRDERSAGHLTRRIHNGLLDVALNGAEHGGVDDAHEDAQRVAAVEVYVAGHVLGEAGGDDDDVVGVAGLGDVLDEEVDHAPQRRVVAHEELGHAEEDVRRLHGAQVLPGVLQVQQLRDHGAALARVLAHGCRVMEDTRLLQHGGLLELRVGRHVVAVLLHFELFRQLLYLLEHGAHAAVVVVAHERLSSTESKRERETRRDNNSNNNIEQARSESGGYLYPMESMTAAPPQQQK